MYCPNCSQPQASDETQFCSRCGLPLGEVKEIVLAGGEAKALKSKTGESSLSPRQKGLRQGALLMLISLVLVPAYILLASLFPADDRLVESSPSDTPFEKISQAVLVTLFVAGLARLLYAWLFQRGEVVSDAETEEEAARLKGSARNYALPPAQSIPVSDFGSWRANTGEVAQPRKPFEQTTRSLDTK